MVNVTKNTALFFMSLSCATFSFAQHASVPSNKTTVAVVLAGTAAIAARGAVENMPSYHGILKCYPMVFATSLAAIVTLDRLRTGGWSLLREFATNLGFYGDAAKRTVYAPDVNTEFACGEDEDFFGSDDDGDDDCCGSCCCH